MLFSIQNSDLISSVDISKVFKPILLVFASNNVSERGNSTYNTSFPSILKFPSNKISSVSLSISFVELSIKQDFMLFVIACSKSIFLTVSSFKRAKKLHTAELACVLISYN